MNFTLGYNALEDRVWLKLGNSPCYWLTRKLLERFVGPSAHLLEKTAPGGEIPRALPPKERIKIDHQEALNKRDDGIEPIIINKQSVLTSKDFEKKLLLISSIKASSMDLNWKLVMTVESKNIILNLSRLDFHRLLQAIFLTVAKAGWEMPSVPDWLNQK